MSMARNRVYRLFRKASCASTPRQLGERRGGGGKCKEQGVFNCSSRESSSSSRQRFLEEIANFFFMHNDSEIGQQQKKQQHQQHQAKIPTLSFRGHNTFTKIQRIFACFCCCCRCCHISVMSNENLTLPLNLKNWLNCNGFSSNRRRIHVMRNMKNEILQIQIL
jgi:hypothetical protein